MKGWQMILILALACITFQAVLPPAAESAPEPPLSWELNDLSGEPHRLEDWRGHWVLLKLGTTVCPNCALEIEELGKIQAGVQALGVEVIAIYLREDRYTVKKYWKKKAKGAYRPVVLYDPRGDLIREYGVSVIPQLVLIDPDGRKAWKGWYTPGPKLLEILEKYVATGHRGTPADAMPSPQGSP